MYGALAVGLRANDCGCFLIIKGFFGLAHTPAVVEFRSLNNQPHQFLSERWERIYAPR